jgi:hypothetical protein
MWFYVARQNNVSFKQCENVISTWGGGGGIS